MALFWTWFLKYSAFFGTGLTSVLVAWWIDRFITRRSKLLFYTTHPQWVTLPPVQGQPAIAPIETFSLFLENQGKAPAREVHVGHFWLPACNVYPDIPREIIATHGGGTAIRFPVIPPRVPIVISYLIFGNFAVENIVSYIGSEDGAAQRIPVMLQRIFPRWVQRMLVVVMFLGAWVLLNVLLTLIRYLWIKFYN